MFTIRGYINNIPAENSEPPRHEVAKAKQLGSARDSTSWCLGGQAVLTAMNLELGFIRAHVAASDLRPAVKILARPAHPPGEMNRFRSCPGETESLPAFDLRAVGPVNRVDNRAGSVNSNQAVKVDGDRAGPTVIARCCAQGHPRDVAVLRGVGGSRQKKNRHAPRTSSARKILLPRDQIVKSLRE